jgi:putative endonuclease
MSQARRVLGQKSEQEAERFLRTLRYVIVARNYRCPLGEIDLIALDQKTLVFVEVRSTRSKIFGSPLESVKVLKQRKLIKTALHYLEGHKLVGRAVRFDVVGIQWEGSVVRITHVKEAFEV